MKMRMRTTCPECGKVFDLLDAYDAQEWEYGHDCWYEGEEQE